MLLLGNSPELRVPLPPGENRRHHCLTKSTCAILFTQSSSVSFVNVWNCSFPTKRSYHVMRTDGSFIRDGFTKCVKADFNIILERHAVDVRKAPRGISRSICQKTRHICSRVSLRQQRAKPLNRTKTAEHLPLESRTYVEKRALLENKSQASGYHHTCRKRLNTLTKSSSRTGFT